MSSPPPNSNEKIVLISDSHTSQLWIGLDKVFKDRYDVVILTSELLDDNHESWFNENQQDLIENYFFYKASKSKF